MGFMVNYNAGGVIDEVKKIHFPANVFPNEKFLKDYTKGLRIDMPAMVAGYHAEFTVPWDCHLVGIATASTGYYDGDFWELFLDEEKRIETCYTKEVPEAKSLTKIFPTIPAGTVVKVVFENASGTSKQVYFDIEFLHE